MRKLLIALFTVIALPNTVNAGNFGVAKKTHNLVNSAKLEGTQKIYVFNVGQNNGNLKAEFLHGEILIKDCYDGDTCISSEGEKIRLACIDTPEIKGKRAKPKEAIAAKNFLNELIKGKIVSIRRITLDKYGRTVGELSFNGENVQQLLVKEGHAEIYKKYSKPCEWAS